MTDKKFLLIRIPYLEGNNIAADGSLDPSVTQGKPVVVMVQGNFCPHCTVAKPMFQEFARLTPSVQAATVQTDGGPTDREAAKNLSKVNTSPGVPAFLGFNKDGKFVAIHSGGRDVSSLQKFAQSLN